MAHRYVMQVMGPLNQWAAMPYFIDPMDYEARPASRWPFDHQKAHDDMNSFLPPYPAAPQGVTGIPSANILVDSDFSIPDSQTWWTFANHREHLAAIDAIQYNRQATALPWWALPPREARIFW